MEITLSKQVIFDLLALGGPTLTLNIANLLFLKKSGDISEDLLEEVVAPIFGRNRKLAKHYAGLADYYVKAISCKVPERDVRIYENDSYEVKSAVLRAFYKGDELGVPSFLVSAVTTRDRLLSDQHVPLVKELLDAGYDADTLCDLLEQKLSVRRLVKNLLPATDHAAQVKSLDKWLNKAKTQKYDEPKEVGGTLSADQVEHLVQLYGETNRSFIKKMNREYYPEEAITEVMEKKYNSTEAQVLRELRDNHLPEKVVDWIFRAMKESPEFAKKRALRYATWLSIAKALDSVVKQYIEINLVEEFMLDRIPTTEDVAGAEIFLLEGIFRPFWPNIDLDQDEKYFPKKYRPLFHRTSHVVAV
jgi:hypothetical protein